VGAGALRQALHEQIELVQDGDPVAAAGDGGGRQRRAPTVILIVEPILWRNSQTRSERRRGLAVAADKMEQWRILALDEHGQHGGITG
jgi:hypothetical protein